MANRWIAYTFQVVLKKHNFSHFFRTCQIAILYEKHALKLEISQYKKIEIKAKTKAWKVGNEYVFVRLLSRFGVIKMCVCALNR